MNTKKLYRSRSNRLLTGVCGGLAEYFGIDPIVVRVLAIIAGCMGWGLLAYILCTLLIPETSI